MTSDDLIRPVGGIGAADRFAVGGKAAGLGELCRAGLPVPRAFVVTALAFARAMQDIDPAGEFDPAIGRLQPADTAAIALVTADIRERIAAGPMPADVQGAISASYRRLGEELDDDGRGVPVAVRSSATGEDSAAASFAGLQDTYLWVRGAQSVLDHVRRCWASLYNAEAVAYRLRQGIGQREMAMGVVIQQMVAPVAAGVMFTCSPATGDRSLVAIEASWGLGSVLVSGEVTPDSFTVSKVTGQIVRRQVSRKTRLHRLHESGYGVVADDVPAHLRDRPCVDDDQIRAIARIGLAAEDHFGSPQDIEWALAAGSGRDVVVVLLQSRPETVWASRAAQPLAMPKARAVDHVFEQLGRIVPGTRPER